MRRAAALLALLLLASAACSSDDGGGATQEEDSGSGNSEGGDQVVDDHAGSMVAGLSLAPAGDADGGVIVNDYAAAGEALGVDRPEAGADEDELADWFIPLTAGREEEDLYGGLYPSTFFGRSALEDEDWREEVGWAPIDVDIAVDIAPNDDHLGFHAFAGEFDADTVDDAVTDEDNVWADELETEEQNGTEFYVWGEDPDASDPERLTTVRNIGRGGTMAVFDDAVLWAWETDLMEDAIDAATGEDDSLADDDELGPLAEAMDSVEAAGGFFSTDGHSFDDAAIGGAIDDLTEGALTDDFSDDIAEDPALEPYDAFATGVRFDDGDPQLVVALLHDDEDAAEANAENLATVVDDGESVLTNRPWSDVLSLDDTEVDGEVLVATLDLADASQAGFWTTFVFQRDSLLAAA